LYRYCHIYLMFIKYLTMKRIIIILLSAIITFTSCELFEEASDGLSTEEVVDGLKTALKVGADTATTVLNQVDGYLKDVHFKIIDHNRKVLYDNADHDYAITWDFSLESSQQLKILVNVPVREEATEEIVSGCVSIMFGFKTE